MIRILFTILLSAVVVGSNAQDMASVFINMPEQQIQQLEIEWRKDLVDLYQAGKEARLQNTIGGFSTLKSLTDNYLFLQITERSTAEMMLLNLTNRSKVICMIITVDGPVADSRLRFYTSEWELLDTDDFIEPATRAWFLKADTDRTSDAWLDAVARLDMELIYYQLQPDAGSLTATYTTPLYLGAEEQKMVAPFLKDEPRAYVWKSNRFQ